MTSSNDTFRHAETIYRDNEDKIIKLKKERRSHLLFLVIFPVIPSLLLIWLVSPLLSVTVEPLFKIGQAFLFLYTALLFMAYPVFDRDYRHKGKLIFMDLMAKSQGLRYRHGGVMRLGDLYDHQVLPPYTFRKIEEGFKGRYGDFSIEFQDFRIGASRNLSFFDYRSLLALRPLRGVVIRIKLNKRLEHHTVLMPSILTHGFLKRNLHEKFLFHEDIGFAYRKFRRRYTILSTNAVEAHYILDPAVIERIMTLGELLSAKWLEISFREREFVIYAQYASNFFEIGHLLEPVSVLSIELSLSQMQSLKAVLEILELNSHAGLGATVPVRKTS